MTHKRRSCLKESPTTSHRRIIRIYYMSMNLPGHVSSRLKPSERKLQTINRFIYPNSNTFVNIKHENEISVTLRNIFFKVYCHVKIENISK